MPTARAMDPEPIQTVGAGWSSGGRRSRSSSVRTPSAFSASLASSRLPACARARASRPAAHRHRRHRGKRSARPPGQLELAGAAADGHRPALAAKGADRLGAGLGGHELHRDSSSRCRHRLGRGRGRRTARRPRPPRRSASSTSPAVARRRSRCRRRAAGPGRPASASRGAAASITASHSGLRRPGSSPSASTSPPTSTNTRQVGSAARRPRAARGHRAPRRRRVEQDRPLVEEPGHPRLAGVQSRPRARVLGAGQQYARREFLRAVISSLDRGPGTGPSAGAPRSGRRRSARRRRRCAELGGGQGTDHVASAAHADHQRAARRAGASASAAIARPQASTRAVRRPSPTIQRQLALRGPACTRLGGARYSISTSIRPGSGAGQQLLLQRLPVGRVVDVVGEVALGGPKDQAPPLGRSPRRGMAQPGRHADREPACRRRCPARPGSAASAGAARVEVDPQRHRLDLGAEPRPSRDDVGAALGPHPADTRCRTSAA